MSGRKIPNNVYLDIDWQGEIESKNLVKKGFYNLDFTNLEDDQKPVIKIGSSIGVDGVLYTFEADEEITGTPTAGFGWVTILGGVTATASFTNTEPTYNYTKKGYYGVSGERYVMRFTNAYANKIILLDQNSIAISDQELLFGSYLVSDWTLRDTPADNDWKSVAYGNGAYVAVSTDGSGNNVMLSFDGVTWTSQNNTVGINWQAITFGDNLFVAVSSSGFIATSPDGINWTSRTAPVANAWVGVTYGSGLFVAVASAGTTDRVMTSPDGIIWTARTVPVANGWRSVTYGNGLFVAVASSGTGDRVMTSPDGINWTSRVSSSDADWQDVAYGNGLFVAVGGAGGNNTFMISSDGITWADTTVPEIDTWRGITFGKGLFVAVGSGSGDVITSSDAVNWISQNTPTLTKAWESVCYGNNVYVAVATTGAYGERAMTSRIL